MTSYVLVIHKKGNYRGTAVIATIGKLYSRVIRNLIEEDIEDNQPEEQSGF